MKILEILPACIDKRPKMYTIVYEQHYKTYSETIKERELLRNFNLDKSEFTRILRLSIINAGNKL
jgi:hypothetical protein